MPTSDGHDDPIDGTADDAEQFGREAAILRSLATEPVELVDAPDDLWARIAAEASGSTATATATDRTATAADPAPPIDLAAHRNRRRPAMVTAAAAAIVAVLFGVGVVALNNRDSAPTELAAAELTPYQDAPVGAAGGRVELIKSGDATQLQVDMHDLPAPAPGTFYELWLLDPETGEPVSVATMRDGSADVTTTIPVPEGTDTTRFDVVDVSVQEDDAGPEHSGNSVLRGTLNA